ncbi:hypothetical protein [uncultured Metabacillus sp.]|uniref:hypothetical protein n=1 Tax=uncultured Metabacillus sp. TaxID=2860135 RepID=UPI00262C80CB|nr:hypothetical protein [uncultured Metabacillus sp.]
MTTKNEIINYFTEKYSDNEFILDAISKSTEEQLQEKYQLSLYRDQEENNILENGTYTYRLSYETKEDEEAILNYMRDNKMYTFDEDGLNFRIRVGNYCIVGVPEKFINKLKENFNITHMDLKRKIIGKKDIEGLKVGDKVKVYIDGIFGLSSDQGTIYEINENEVIVRKYRSRTKGYTIQIGHIGEIEKVSKFTKTA